MCMDYNN